MKCLAILFKSFITSVDLNQYVHQESKGYLANETMIPILTKYIKITNFYKKKNMGENKKQTKEGKIDLLYSIYFPITL